MVCCIRKINKKNIKQAQKLTFAMIMVPVHDTNCIIFIFFIIQMEATKMLFVVKRYAVRKVKIRPYAERRLK